MIGHIAVRFYEFAMWMDESPVACALFYAALMLSICGAFHLLDRWSRRRRSA